LIDGSNDGVCVENKDGFVECVDDGDMDGDKVG